MRVYFKDGTYDYVDKTNPNNDIIRICRERFGNGFADLLSNLLEELKDEIELYKFRNDYDSKYN